MNHNHFSLFLSIICTSSLIRHASGLNVEGILNGDIANIADFPYQAAILGKSEGDIVYTLLCAGAIVSPLWILSVAHCFMMTSEVIKQLAFMAVVGSTSLAGLTPPNDSMKKIEYVYINRYNAEDKINDIIMAKTDSVIRMSNTVKLVNIASPGRSFFNYRGSIAGYGCSDFVRGDQGITLIETDLKLRNTSVIVLPINLCYVNFLETRNDDTFCGRAVDLVYLSDFAEITVEALVGMKSTGACTGDHGTPLVINNEVVGLSAETYGDCRDSATGSLYVYVSHQYTFIDNVKRGNIQSIYNMHRVNQTLFLL